MVRIEGGSCLTVPFDTDVCGDSFFRESRNMGTTQCTKRGLGKWILFFKNQETSNIINDCTGV